MLGTSPDRPVANTTAVVRVMNERAVYQQVLRRGPVSAPQLATVTGLSRATVGLALASLERVGLVRNVGRRVGQVGRAPRLFQIRPEAGWALAVDVGASWIRAAVADLSGTVAARADDRVRAREAPALARQIGELARAIPGRAGIATADITFTVVGTPGIYEPAADRIIAAPNLPGWELPGSVGALRAELGEPGERLAIDNDVNLATLAEQAHGVGAAAWSAAGGGGTGAGAAAGSAANFVFVSVGTGVGMGIVIGGQLYRGSSGRAGEISYLPIGEEARGRPRAPSADAQRHGILETAASGMGVLAAARRRGLHAESAGQVFDAARSGNPTASLVVRAEAEHLARGLAAVIAVLDPGVVVLGGGVAGSADLLLEPTRRRVGELLGLAPPPIVMSALGRDSVLLGALAAGLDRVRDDVLARIEP